MRKDDEVADLSCLQKLEGILDTPGVDLYYIHHFGALGQQEQVELFKRAKTLISESFLAGVSSLSGFSGGDIMVQTLLKDLRKAEWY